MEGAVAMAYAYVDWEPSRYVALLPKIDPEASKYSRGSLAVIGGSARFTGAPVLSALAAARTGAGYVTLVVPSEMETVARMHLLSIPVIGAPSRNGTFLSGATRLLTDELRHLDAVAIGPGMCCTAQTSSLVEEVLSNLDMPVVVDADGLNAISGRALTADRAGRRPGVGNRVLTALVARNAAGHATILTPHDGELARIVKACAEAGLDLPVDLDGGSDRADNAMAVATATGSIVVAKGRETVIAGDGKVLRSAFGSAALAKAGTGDVLTGVIGAFAASGLAAFDAAALGVVVHSLAGEHARSALSLASVMAEDVVEAIPAALKQIARF